MSLMETSNPSSFFQHLRARELNGFRVRKRPIFCDSAPDFREVGAMAMERDGSMTPPLAISFGKSGKSSHILAVSDEDGYVSLFDTRRKFSSSLSHQENAERTKVSEWTAHHNAVFDLCWVKEDTRILTASGDQTMKVWDVQEKKCVAVLMGHTGSVKSMSLHPTNPEIIVSGSRDGSFALWDMRCSLSSKSRREELRMSPSAVVKGAHLSPHAKRVTRRKTASMSITSVLYLKDGLSIATAGAVDSVVKFWDTRNLKSAVTKTSPRPNTKDKEKRLHGISSLSQDLNGVSISASCMDNRIYLYNLIQLEKGPVKSFSGCQIGTFFVKSSISPDAAHILSGSSDGNAYIWKVGKPQEDPIQLKNHHGEVTAVDWCSNEDGKFATCADDFTARVWNSQTTYCSSAKSPSTVRRRVMATPGTEYRKLLMNETSDIAVDSKTPQPEKVLEKNFNTPITMPKLSTPEAQEKRCSLDSNLDEICEKTPETMMKSPSSVLNPPSSLKRKTIRDYFLSSV